MDSKSLFGLIILTALIIWGLIVWGSQAPSKDDSGANSGKNQIEQISDPDELTLGPTDALVQIIEYSDIQCPACAFADQVINQLIQNNPDKIQLVYRHFPLSYHPLARPGALALQAAHRQGKFKQMKDALFDNQRELTADLIQQIAAEIGLNMDRYSQDIQDPRLKAKVEQDYQKGLELGIKATPTIYLNGEELKEFADIDTLQIKIDQIVISQ
jgi:protein-disulfide isomerase